MTNKILTTTTTGIGYFETIFSDVALSTMAAALKQFALEDQITSASEAGEVLNIFVKTLIQTADFEAFQRFSGQLFSYPKQYEGTLEVELIEPSKEEWGHLQENIEQLLQVQPEKGGH